MYKSLQDLDMVGMTGVIALVIGLSLVIMSCYLMRRGKDIRATVPEDGYKGAADEKGATLRYSTTLIRSGYVLAAIGLFNMAWGLLIAIL
jgi:hypothetical protein